MSSNGYRSAVLDRRRKEQIRLRQVQKQARSLLNACQKQIRNIKDPTVQQLAAGKLKEIQKKLSLASGKLDNSPDSGLSAISQQQKLLNETIATAQAEAERLRIEETKKQARELLASSEKIIKGISDPSIQQLTAGSLKQIQQQMQQASEQIQSDPKQAKETTAKLQQQLKKIVSDAQAELKESSKQKTQAKAQLESVRQNLEAEKESTNKAGNEALVRAQKEVDKASTLYKQGNYEEVTGICDNVAKLIKESGQKTLDESVRREVVGGLLSTLMNMGFVVDTPQLEGDDPATGVVKLVGRMPSGKRAAFQVNLDGRMNFDFDGYEGRACAKDMEVIGKTLQEQFSVKLGDAQVTWKNPDKIAKGALNVPSGNINTINH